MPGSLRLSPPGPPSHDAAAPAAAVACWLAEPGRAELRVESLSPPGPGDVQVRALYSAVSRGTELLVYRGAVPPGEYQRMRAPFQAGDFPAPVKYGYCSVGVVEAGVPHLQGRCVFCLHPHQTRYVVPADQVHVLPDTVPAARAVLAANLETAINALWDASPHIGDRVAVVGGGVVGLLVAWLASRLPGCVVQVVDTLPSRGPVAQALGAQFALPHDAAPGADVVIHASGQADGLATALRLAAFEATVLELSWYGEHPVNAPLGGAFHSQRLTLKSSQVGHVAAAQRSRWTHARRMGLALALLADPALDALVTDTAAFAELPAVLARLAAGAATRCASALTIPPPDSASIHSRTAAMYSVNVRDHFMIAHSFRGAVFGPAQHLHGATYVVDLELRRTELDPDGVVVDIGLATQVLHTVLGELNFRNLDDEAAFKGRNTTTEFLARTLFDRIAARIQAGELGPHAHGLAALRVTLHESHVAWAAYEAALPARGA